MAQLKNTTISDTGFLQLPVGTTEQRPTPAAGQMRFNPTLGRAEFYNATQAAWKPTINQGIIATGGNSVYDVDVEGTTYRVHVFTNTGNSTFTVTQGGSVEYLIVAGGGGTAGDVGGGGGGGGLLSGTAAVTPQNYTINVGNGGAGAPPSSENSNTRNNGQNSSAFGLTSIGGGAGANYNGNGPARDGGSGGGASGGTANSGGSGTTGQGNNGGNHAGGTSPQRSAGGGGAGNSGGNDGSSFGGSGGIGIASTITGIVTFYAGGGGGGFGGAEGQNAGGPGGFGGGGNGKDRLTVNSGNNGTPNTGGGGGGNAHPHFGGADGGSGIVIVRYPLRQENPVQAEGKAVGDGLVLDLDFAKPTVYSGSGTTVSDSRLNGISGTLVNSPVFTDPRTHRSSFDLNRNSSGFISFTNEFLNTANATNVSYSFWVNANWGGLTGYRTVIGIQQSSFERVATLVLNSGQTNISFDLRNAGVSNRDLITTNLNSFANQWLYITYTFDNGTHRLYTNGSLSTTQTGTLTTFPSWSTGGGFAIGENLASSRYFGEQFGLVQVFNKTLSLAEIQQNFNATRWRFGV